MTLLGGFEARLTSAAAVDLPTRKAQALLAYLALRPGQAHRRDKLAALLWGGKPEAQARGDLRHALVALRRALAGVDPPALRVDSQALALDAEAVEVDVFAFEAGVARGTPEALDRAAALYRGDLLLGFGVDEPLFEEWVVSERERLREMALEALARRLAQQTREADTERAIRTAVRLLALDPLQEAVHRALMRLYARQGRRGAALKQYQVCLGVLARELGTAPEAETRTLYEKLLRPAADADAGAPAAHPLRRPAHGAAPAEPAEPPGHEIPLCGRRDELRRLRALLDDARHGRGHAVTVRGEAGIGKSRLVSSVAADALGRGFRVIVGRCHESDSILPFGPWVDALRAADVSADEELLAGLHPARRAELARLLPEVGIAGLPRATDSALPLFESVAGLVELLAARQPLLLVLADLHWADEMSLRLLAFVGRRVSSWRALLTATAREEELGEASMARRTLDELGAAPHGAALQLSPLSRPDTDALVRALARVGSEAATLAQVADRVWAVSEGNPFVAVEVMRALPLDDRPAALPLPARVRELVQRRLDQLGARAQELAAVAAVIGRRFDFALLQGASGADDREATGAVEEMVRHGILQAVGTELDFTHGRIREVAYAGLLPPRRRLLHRAVAGALEVDAGTRAGSGERVERLAHHAVRGELWDQAVRCLRQAGERAAARSALRDARRWFEQALGALRALPETPAALEEGVEIRLALRPVLIQLGEYRAVLDVLRQAGVLAERLGDEGRQGRVLAFLTNLHCRLDEPDEAIATGERALAIAARRGDAALRVLATMYVEQAHYYRGEYARVIALATASLAATPPELAGEFLGASQPPAINDRFRLIVSLAHLGRFAEAARYEAEVIAMAEAIGHPYAVGVAYHAASTLRLIKGDWTHALALGERRIAALRAGTVAGEMPSALADSARALARLGRADEAHRRRREAERLLAEQPGRPGSGWTWHSLGQACLVLDELTEARRFAERAAEPAGSRVDGLPDALLLLGDVAAGLDPASGEPYYRRALALAAARGMRPVVAHCRLGLGALFARTGRPDEAAEHMDAAAAMYRDMEMGWWTSLAEARSVPPPAACPVTPA